MIIVVVLLSCQKKDKLCTQLKSEVSEKSFYDDLVICDSSGNEIFSKGMLEILQIDDEKIYLTLKGDTLVDTTFIYKHNCVIEKKTSHAFLDIYDENDNLIGRYSGASQKFYLRFNYYNCVASFTFAKDHWI